MFRLILSLVIVVGSWEAVFAQKPDQASDNSQEFEKQFGQNIGALMQAAGGLGKTSAASVLREDVDKELRLSDEQREKLIEVSKDDAATTQRLGLHDGKIIANLSAEEIKEAQQKIREDIASRREQSFKDVAKILSDRQSARLKELRFQYEFLSSGRITPQRFASAGVPVSREMLQQLDAAVTAAEDKLAPEIAKLRRRRYIESLVEFFGTKGPDELMGDPFIFERYDQLHRPPKPSEVTLDDENAGKRRRRQESPRRRR